MFIYGMPKWNDWEIICFGLQVICFNILYPFPLYLSTTSINRSIVGVSEYWSREDLFQVPSAMQYVELGNMEPHEGMTLGHKNDHICCLYFWKVGSRRLDLYVCVILFKNIINNVWIIPVGAIAYVYCTVLWLRPVTPFQAQFPSSHQIKIRFTPNNNFCIWYDLHL